jgi:hypothetical protein
MAFLNAIARGMSDQWWQAIFYVLMSVVLVLLASKSKPNKSWNCQVNASDSIQIDERLYKQIQLDAIRHPQKINGRIKLQKLVMAATKGGAAYAKAVAAVKRLNADLNHGEETKP